MSNYKNWNKKAALFASGLVCALCFRIPISIASYCVTRFNLDPSHLNIFTSRIVNAMLVGQLFGNWLGVLLSALDGKTKLWVIATSNWLCLISFSFSLFCFVHSEEGHLTGFYWSHVVVNFFAKVSDAQCVEIAAPESTIWYVSSSTSSSIYISSMKVLLRVLINWTDERNTIARVTAFATLSVETTTDYHVAKWMIVCTIVLTSMISALWTALAILVKQTGRIEGNSIRWLKYISGVTIGAILAAPASLLGVAAGSLLVKCLKYWQDNSACAKSIMLCQIIFITVGSLTSFVSSTCVFCNFHSESERWVPSSMMNASTGDNGKILLFGLGGGLLLGSCLGAIAVRFKGNSRKITLAGLAFGSLLGAAVGLMSSLYVNAHIHLHFKIYATELDLNKLVSKAHFTALPTLNDILGWATQLDPSEPPGPVNIHNNKWARVLQKANDVTVNNHRGTFDMSKATVADLDVLEGLGANTIEITVKGLKSSSRMTFLDRLDSTGQDKIIAEVQKLFNKEFGEGAVSVNNVEGQAQGTGQLRLTLTMNDDNKWAKAIRNLKGLNLKKKGVIQTISLSQANVDVTKVTMVGASNQINIVVGLVETWPKAADLKSTTEQEIEAALKQVQTVNVVGMAGWAMEKGQAKILPGKSGQWNFGSARLTKDSVTAIEGSNEIRVTVNDVKGSSRGDTLGSDAAGAGKIIAEVQKLFNKEFGEGSVKVYSVTGRAIVPGRILLSITVVGYVQDTDLKSITQEIQKVFDCSFGKDGVKATVNKAEIGAVDGKETMSGRITITVTGENMWEQAIQKVPGGKLDLELGGQWFLSQAKVDNTFSGVRWEEPGKVITITLTNVLGATSGQVLNPDEQGAVKLKNAMKSIVKKTFGTDFIQITHVEGRANMKDQISLTFKLGIEEVSRKDHSAVMGETFKRLTKQALLLQKPEVTFGWVSSLIMSVLGMGTVYSVYPGMAPCSITEPSYFNKINIIILILSAIPPIVIISVSEATLGGPEEKWNGESKGWYIGMLLVIVQVVCMIIVIFVLQKPGSKLAQAVKLNPFWGGVLTVMIVICQETSTSIGYAGVAANSGFTMMTFNNTATLTTMVLMRFLGDGYLTELKKYEPGKWPTEWMGKCEGFRWWFGRVFANAWQIFSSIYTKDLRRDITRFPQNNKHTHAISFAL